MTDITTQAPAIDEAEQRRRDGIRADFERRRGYWAADWQMLLDLDPDFLAAYTDMSAYAIEHGHLEPRLRELIYVATCASVSHQHPIGIRQHGRNALDLGATPEQLLAVMELVSTLGIATIDLAAAELERAEPGTAARIAAESGTTPEALDALRARYTEVFDASSDGVDAALQAASGYYAATIELAAIPRGAGSALDARERALIMFAVNALVTHRDAAALRRDIAAAKAAGVTPEELLDVSSQVAGIGVHAITVGVPILAELIAERAAKG